MSNALYTSVGPAALAAAAAEARSAPASPDSISPTMMSLIALGVCVLAVWIVRRLARPSKLSLTDTPGRHNTVNPLHILGVFLLAYLTGMLLRASLGLASSRATIAATLVTGTLLLAGSLLVARRTFRFGLRRGLGLSGRHWIYDTGRGIVGYLAVLPVCIALLILTRTIMRHIPSDHVREMLQRPHVLLEALRTLPAGWKVLGVLAAVFMPAAAEEVFFRGLLQSMLRRYTARPWTAILVTSFIFALVHAPLWYSLPPLFALSVVMGYNYERSGRLFGPILIHALFNGVFVGLQLAGSSGIHFAWIN